METEILLKRGGVTSDKMRGGAGFARRRGVRAPTCSYRALALDSPRGCTPAIARFASCGVSRARAAPIGEATQEGMEEYTRRLIHVPIIHSPADMGSMGTELADACIAQLGRRHWEDYVAMLATFWQSVRTGLDKLELDYGQVDLYQDGLPVCGKELDIANAPGGILGSLRQVGI